MLGVAHRIAQRMGIHLESANTKCTGFEAEMRRRLWWALVLFDTRISEMVDYTNSTLLPTWDCKLPLNVNDSDLRPDMKEPPALQQNATEAVFAVVRSELGEYIRHSAFHLDFSNPILKVLAKTQDSGGLAGLEKRIEKNYLRFCNPENPLHYVTIWMTRAFLAKYKLVEHYSKSAPIEQTDTERDAALSYGLRMLECDTKVLSSPLTKGYTWMANLYFPFPAYIQILQDLRRRPLGKLAEQAWEVMNDNYHARFISPSGDDSPIFKVFSKIVLSAWKAREEASMQMDQALTPPDLVLYFRDKVFGPAQGTPATDTTDSSDFMGQGVDDFAMSMPMGFSGPGMPFDMGGAGGFGGMGMGPYPNTTGAPNVDMRELVWAAMDWGFVNPRGGGPVVSTAPTPQMPGPLPPMSGPPATGPWKFS